MTIGKNMNTGITTITLSAAESERFQRGEQVSKLTETADGKRAVILSNGLLGSNNPSPLDVFAEALHEWATQADDDDFTDGHDAARNDGKAFGFQTASDDLTKLLALLRTDPVAAQVFADKSLADAKAAQVDPDDEDDDEDAVDFLVVLTGRSTGRTVAERLPTLEKLVGQESTSVDDIGGNTDVLFRLPREKAEELQEKVEAMPGIEAVSIGD